VSYTGKDVVNKIPKKIQPVLSGLGVQADGGYFTRYGPELFPTGKPDTVFTAWMKGEVVQVLGYDAEQKAWVPYTHKEFT
jgi:hypothetical protein